MCICEWFSRMFIFAFCGRKNFPICCCAEWRRRKRRRTTKTTTTKSEAFVIKEEDWGGNGMNSSLETRNQSISIHYESEKIPRLYSSFWASSSLLPFLFHFFCSHNRFLEPLALSCRRNHFDPRRGNIKKWRNDFKSHIKPRTFFLSSFAFSSYL